MTDEKDEKIEQVWMLLQELRETLKTAAIGFVHGGKILCEIYTKKLYPRGESFYGFITDNVGLGKSTINDRMNAWKRFGELILRTPDFQQIDPTKLRRLLPHVRLDSPDDEKEELLHMAATLSVSDLVDALRERAGKAPCGHSGWIEVIKRCRRCGKLLEHMADDMNDIMERSAADEETQTVQT